MKKILIAIITLLCVGAFAAETVQMIDVDVTSSTNTADGVYTVKTGRVVSLLGVYCDVGGTTQTNTFTVDVVRSGETAEDTAGAKASAVALSADTTIFTSLGEATGEDATALLYVEGDTLNFDGTGTASSNVTYKVLLKVKTQ